LTTTATARPRSDQQRAFSAQIALARETGKPLMIHTRAAEDDTLAQLAAEAQGLSVVLHCFSMPERLDECLERGYEISFAGTSPTKVPRIWPRRRGWCLTSGCWWRPTLPT